MIQFNLLPDVKKEYVKAKRLKRLIMSASVLVSAGIVGITVLMFTFVHVAQKRHISSLTSDIENTTTEIKSTDNLNDILTVQNQLSLLPGLHESKPETSRVFDYIAFVSPGTVRLSSLNLNLEDSTVSLSGSADTIATVNKFVDNIKAATYASAGSDDEQAVYNNVATDLSGGNEGATFSINMGFDEKIFDNTQEILMRIEPSIVSEEGL